MEHLNVYKEFTTNHTNQHKLLPHILLMFVMTRTAEWRYIKSFLSANGPKGRMVRGGSW